MFALRQLQERYRERYQDLNFMLFYLENAHARISREELY